MPIPRRMPANPDNTGGNIYRNWLSKFESSEICSAKRRREGSRKEMAVLKTNNKIRKLPALAAAF
jgi:hypothetical protein